MARFEESKHLQTLLETQSGAVDAQVVFMDIVSYSRRRSTTQKQVVERFQDDLRESIIDSSKNNIDYIHKNGINLSSDVVLIPTGDGAAVVFSFNGLQTIGLDFAISMLNVSYNRAVSDPCDRFLEQGWCNCHSHYKVRIGINEGKNIFYKDVNGQVNVAGSCINDAARIMGRADGNQILLSEIAYNNLIDMSSDLGMEGKLTSRGSVRVKHGKELLIYQYVGTQEPFIAREAPINLQLEAEVRNSMARIGMGNMFGGGTEESDKVKMVQQFRDMTDFIEKLGISLNKPASE